MTAITLNLSTFGLISASVLLVAYSLWENWRSDKRSGARYRKAWLDASEQAHQARIQLIRYESIVDAAEKLEAWAGAGINDPTVKVALTELFEAVDWHHEHTLPPPTGEPIT